ncbi:ataxin-7 isoform X4 [Brachyhypopomus gauderio]|uniref:ataxin-7 isoform X4 n=1 Tax=Brachyhypopomus gauderio TaxID=698409 RepID=UPI004042E551
MSERADDDVRGEQRKAARLVKQPLQRGEDSTAMATVAERRSLPSPEVILGQAWSNWVDAVKLHGNDGAESEESFKECGKNREAMRLCRDDMPIFGQCPAQDDFYLVMCSHCSQVIKPQAFQAHYERRHGSVSKLSSSAAYSLPGFSSRGRSGGGAAAGPLGASSGGSNSAPSAKEKLPHRKSHFPLKMLHNDILTPAIKVEKIHLKMDYPSSKPAHVPASPASASSITVSSSPTKPGLNTPSVPKAQLLTLAHLPNGKGHPASLDKKQDGGSSLSSKRLYRRPLEREFNPDVHCGVLDMGARKPCTRSLTCKTHSLSQRRAVPGRSFDALLAEHRGRTRDRELQHRAEPSLQAPPLRDLPPPSSRLLPHGNSVAADSPKPSALSKPKPHNHSLPRVNSSSYGGLGDPAVAHELSQHPHTAPTPDGVGHPSSDEGEPEDREDPVEKLDCHYSGHHPRPTAYCTFGSLQLSRSWFAFDRRWNRVRCALAAMMDKHVNSLMWKKIPLVQENSSSSAVPLSQRSSANSLSSSFSSGFLSPSPPLPYGQSYESKPVLSYGTTLNARATPQRAGEQPAYGGSSNSSRQVSSSSPQMPSAHSSSLPSAQGSSKPNKSRSGTKSFRVREPSPASSNSGAVSVSGSAGATALGSGKKRKNSSQLMPHGTYNTEPSSSSSSSSFRKNCAVNSGTSGSSGGFHSSLSSATPSPAPPTSAFSTSSSPHAASLPLGRPGSLSLRQDVSSRALAPSGPAEPIKRMSVVMNSSDSTLSLGPFVHQGSEHHGRADGPRLDSKRRRSSPATSSSAGAGTCTASTVGGGGVLPPGRPKMAKSPAINNIHGRHTRPMPGPPGLPNSSLIHQPKARP